MSGMRSSIALTSRSWVNTSARSRTRWRVLRSEEHTSELQSLMRISYAVFCLKKKKKQKTKTVIKRINISNIRRQNMSHYVQGSKHNVIQNSDAANIRKTM